jgi:ABC-type glycerol-3-phosphate transport system permease component
MVPVRAVCDQHNQFDNIVDSVFERARKYRKTGVIDGASQFQIMTRITIPLSFATIAVIGLFYNEEIWNSYLRAMIGSIKA